MTYLPITLGIGRSTASPQSLKKIETQMQEIRPKIFERDNHTCRFCGFHSAKYQEICHLNGHSDDIKPDNLVTACIFCNQCFDLEKSSQMNSGVLVWLPEIEQAELNHIARAIYVARISQGTMADAARGALEVLMARREEAKTRMATDDPFFLATVLRDFVGPKHYAARTEKLKGIRLFPLDRRNVTEGELKFNQFPQILAYWRSKDGPFGGILPATWKSFYAKINSAA